MDTAVVRRAASAAQAILRESSPDLQVDGKPGNFTASAYKMARASMRGDVDAVVVALGVPGGFTALTEEYEKLKARAISLSTSGDDSEIFDLQVVPAIVRLSRERGVNPAYPIALLALESAWGKKVPRTANGQSSLNFGGIKWNTVKTKDRAEARTKEFMGGKLQSVSDGFAVFETPLAFAKAFMDYVYENRRYVGIGASKTASEFGGVLQKGGYATDPDYAKKIAAMANSAARKYALPVVA